MSLASIQQRFSEALLNVDMVQQALPLFVTSDSSLEARLAFYRGNQTSSWTGALSGAYPVLQQLVGAEFFEQMARDYGRIFPSRCGDLNHFGTDFPKYLAGLSMIGDYPYFVDVAALEWKVHQSYYAADADILTLPTLLADVGESVQDARLKLHPATQLHASKNACVPVWLAHQSGYDEKEQVELSLASYALITRSEWQVSVTPIAEVAFYALQALVQQKSLGEALEVALAADADFDIAGALATWFSAGAFSGVDEGSV